MREGIAMASDRTLARRTRWHPLLWAAIAALLVLPLVAMRFTREVDWTPGDFAAAALLLGGGGLAFEVAMRRVTRPAARLAAGCAIGLAVALVWAEGAVGLLA